MRIIPGFLGMSGLSLGITSFILIFTLPGPIAMRFLLFTLGCANLAMGIMGLCAAITAGD